MTEKKLHFIFEFSAVTPEPDSTEDSTGIFDSSDLPELPGLDHTRRMSQPVTGSAKESDENDKVANRRASEGSNKYPRTDEDEKGRMAITSTGVGADWSSEASSLSHVFIPTSSGDTCYLGMTTSDCKQSSGNSISGVPTLPILLPNWQHCKIYVFTF